MHIKIWNSFEIRYRDDGYFCLEDLEKACNIADTSSVSPWRYNAEISNKIYLMYKHTGIPIFDLIQDVGGITFVHPLMAKIFVEHESSLVESLENWLYELSCYSSGNL